MAFVFVVTIFVIFDPAVVLTLTVLA